VKPRWVAGGVRARLLARRGLGPAGARSVAAAGSAAAAIGLVAASPYARSVSVAMSLIEAEHGVRATALWHLRVIAGWLPSQGSDVVRTLAGGHEIANVEAYIDRLVSGRDVTPFELGSLAAAWPRVRMARTIGEVRAALRTSPWGDPGTDEPAAIAAALRLAWARRIAEQIPELRRWATIGAAIVVAGVRFGNARDLSGPAAADARRVLGPRWEGSGLGSFSAALPVEVRRMFADLTDSAGLSRVESAWWRPLADDAVREIPSSSGAATVAWSAALLLADAQRVCGALEAAAWGPAGLEAFDAIA